MLLLIAHVGGSLLWDFSWTLTYGKLARKSPQDCWHVSIFLKAWLVSKSSLSCLYCDFYYVAILFHLFMSLGNSNLLNLEVQVLYGHFIDICTLCGSREVSDFTCIYKMQNWDKQVFPDRWGLYNHKSGNLLDRSCLTSSEIVPDLVYW